MSADVELKGIFVNETTKFYFSDSPVRHISKTI